MHIEVNNTKTSVDWNEWEELHNTDKVRFVYGENTGEYFEIYWDRDWKQLKVRSGWYGPIHIIPEVSNAVRITIEEPKDIS